MSHPHVMTHGRGQSSECVCSIGEPHPYPPAETTLPRVLEPDMRRALTAAGRKVAEWTAERDRLVKEAVKAGGSLREVGDAAGISHTAVKFIAHGRPK